jgi:hypothetical protein
LWQKLDVLSGLFLATGVISVIIFVVWLFVQLSDGVGKKPSKIILVIGIISIIIGAMIPSTKEAEIIYVLPKIVNNKKIQKISDKMLEMTNLKLDEMIESLKEKK